MEDGKHSHGADNPFGLHCHPSIGILKMGGPHDHAVIYGDHIHRAEDGRILVHLGGYHDHWVWESGDVTENSGHSHRVLGAKASDGNDMVISVANAEGLAIARPGSFSVLAKENDAEGTVKIMKSLEGTSDYTPTDGWIIGYSYEDKVGHYDTSVEKACGVKIDTEEEATLIAKEFAKSYGTAELCKKRGVCKDAILVDRLKIFTVEKADIAFVAPISQFASEPWFNTGYSVDRQTSVDEVSFVKRMFGVKGKSIDLKDEDFALIRKDQRSLPMDTLDEGRNALVWISSVKPPVSLAEKDLIITNVTKRWPELGDAEDRATMEAEKKFIPTVCSLRLSKTQFREKDAAVSWIAKAGFSSEKCAEIGSSWIFDQAPSNGESLLVEEVAEGVMANYLASTPFEKLIPFSKVNNEERTVEGIVYEPNVKDSQGDWMDASDIKIAAWDFMKSNNTNNVDIDHDEVAREGVSVVESFIAKDDDKHYPPGAWVAKSHISDDDTWISVQKGFLNGYSMGGVGAVLEGIDPPSFSIQKSMFGFGMSGKVEKKTPHGQLKKVKVGFLSLVGKGANNTDWKFKKAHGPAIVNIFKSNDIRLFESSLVDSQETLLTRVSNGLFDMFGPQGTNSGSNVAPVSRKVEKMQPTVADFINLMVTFAKRAGDSEAILQKLAQTEALAKTIEGDPVLQAALTHLDPTTLQKFASGAEGFLKQESGGPVTLPGLENFFGFVQSIDPAAKYTHGKFPGGGVTTSTFGDNASEILSKQAEVDKMTAEIEKMKAGDMKDSKKACKEGKKADSKLPAFLRKEDLAETLADVLAPLVKSIQSNAAELETMKAASIGKQSAAVPAALTGNVETSNDTITIGKSDDDDVDEIKLEKAERAALFPFSDMHSIINGINFDGPATPADESAQGAIGNFDLGSLRTSRQSS